MAFLPLLSSSPSSSSLAYSLHMAMAALFGASVMAVSAFFIDMRSFDQCFNRLKGLHSSADHFAAFPSESDENAASDNEDDHFLDDSADATYDGQYIDCSETPPPPPNVEEEEAEMGIEGLVWGSRSSPSDVSLRLDAIQPEVLPTLQLSLGLCDGIPSGEEVEVCAVIRECLALRRQYVYRESVAPWKEEMLTNQDASKTNHDPFYFHVVESTAHHFQMEDGVVHVYPSKDSTEDLFPVANSTKFFTDMHHILKVMSLGNVRSTCHHRLRLLEELVGVC